MSWPTGIRKWTIAEIIADAAIAREAFRARRFREPMREYLDHFRRLRLANRKLLRALPELLAEPVDPALLADFLRDPELRTAIRYLGAPPISEDDLKTLSDSTLAYTRVRHDPEQARAIRDVIAAIIDPIRFRWLTRGRTPRVIEGHAAIVASATVAAAQRVQTSRRIGERELLQGSVHGVLIGIGFEEVRLRAVQSILKDAPRPGTFAVGCTVGEDGADFVVGLRDHRILAIECKASNSELNSRKRINKEVMQDAQNWLRRFGHDTVIPAAAIQGVFKPEYIEAAQETPLAFFWGHRLEALRDFILDSKA